MVKIVKIRDLLKDLRPRKIRDVTFVPSLIENYRKLFGENIFAKVYLTKKSYQELPSSFKLPPPEIGILTGSGIVLPCEFKNVEHILLLISNEHPEFRTEPERVTKLFNIKYVFAAEFSND